MIDRDDVELFERSLRQATERATGAELDAALADLGWLDVVEAEPAAGVSLLFDLQGRGPGTSSALELLLAHQLGFEAPAVVLPPIGHWRAPAAVRGDRLVVAGLGTANLAGASSALTVAAAGDRHLAKIVATASLDLHPVPGVDPALGLVRVTGEVPLADATPGDAAGDGTGAGAARPVDWPSAVAWGQLAVGHELVGASRRMLELARQHALDRVQFGQPIAKFQAVRHRLAETLVSLELAGAALGAAWLDPSPQTAAMAKALAGRGARTAARHCQQVMGAIGFTTEHDLHLFVRRVLVLEQLFGAPRLLTRELGTEILECRRIPAPLPL